VTTPAAPPADTVKRAQQCLTGLKSDRTKLDRIDNYVRGKHAGPYTPRNASQEYRILAARSISNFLPMVVAAPAQSLSVEGYHRQGADEDAPEWQAWQANGLDARQAAIYRAAITYGHAFTVTLPDEKDPKKPVVRALSPRNMWAAYDDPSSDEWPMYALELPKLPGSDGTVTGRYYDDVHVYEVTADEEKVTLGRARAHGLGVCPVRRFAAQVDLEGRTTGAVEPLIPLQDRINQSVFDLLIAQTYGSFKVRTISGMAPPLKRDPETGEPVLDADGNPVPKPITMDASRLLMAPDADTKFGTLDETPLGGYIESIGMSVRHLAVVSQVPPHYLLGDMINLSAEALAAAETTLMRMVAELKRGFGESHESNLRLFAKIMGLEQASTDLASQVRWADTESRSLSQLVDALGKAVQMLGVPKQAVWPKLPGFSDTDRANWPELAAAEDSQQALASSLMRAAESRG
jgi:hypothetical protein